MTLSFVFQKVMRALLAIWMVFTFAFIILRISGDPVTGVVFDDAPPEVLEHYRRLWGFDRPIWEQYLTYFQNAFRGDFGTSIVQHRDALEMVLERVPNTLWLGGTALLLVLSIGVPAGVFAALNRNSVWDRVIMVFAVSGHSIPNFFLAVLLIMLFAVGLNLLPATGDESFAHMVMPAFTLGTSGAAVIARFTRGAMLEVLEQPYVQAALAKGEPWQRVVWRHAFPNAAIPMATIVGFILGGMIGGSIITETVFAWRGVGELLVNSVGFRDVAVAQVILLMVATSMVCVNLIVDLLYGWLDPRVQTDAQARQPGGRP